MSSSCPVLAERGDLSTPIHQEPTGVCFVEETDLEDVDLFVTIVLRAILLDELAVVSSTDCHGSSGVLIEPPRDILDVDHGELASADEDVSHLLFYQSCQANLKRIAF